MTKPKLTAQEFADEINRRIQHHPGYQAAQSIAPVPTMPPPVAGELRGAGLVRHWMARLTDEQRAAFDDVEAEIRREFDVDDYRQ